MHAPDLYYGIDIGGTKMELVACDRELQVRYRQRVPTPTGDFRHFVDALLAMVHEADAALGAPAALGLGVPGILDASGAHLSANVPCLTGRRLLPLLRECLARPIAIGNDCQCFALSEAHGGAADGAPSMFGLIIGTGAGGGYVTEGRMLRGRQGVAGEWGHWPLGPALLKRHELPALPCACGGTACLECYVSGTGLRRLHAQLSGTEGADAETLATAWQAGDALAIRVFSIHLDLLGAALAQVVLAYDPHVVVLGGGLSLLPHLRQALPAATTAHLLAGLSAPPILAPVFGAAGGARGAALLAVQAAQPLIKEA